MYRTIVPFHPMNVLILRYDIHIYPYIIPYRRCDSLIVQLCQGHHSDDVKPEQFRTPSRYCPALSQGWGRQLQLADMMQKVLFVGVVWCDVQ